MTLTPPTAGSNARAGTSHEGLAMAAALKALLDPVARSRQVLPHLAALELNLTQDGLAVLKRASTKSLVKLGQELATLPVQPDNLPLQRLMSALLDELDRRARPRPAPGPSSAATDALVVTEITHSDFMAAGGMAGPKSR